MKNISKLIAAGTIIIFTLTMTSATIITNSVPEIPVQIEYENPMQNPLKYAVFTGFIPTIGPIAELMSEPLIVTTIKPEPELEQVQIALLDAYGNELDPLNTWGKSSWEGSKINKKMGINNGPSGFETYYNLKMGGIFRWFGEELAPYTAEDMWVNDQGIKMLGPYVMVASDLKNRPRGSLINTSVGMGIVVDYNGHINISGNWTDLDIAVTW